MKLCAWCGEPIAGHGLEGAQVCLGELTDVLLDSFDPECPHCIAETVAGPTFDALLGVIHKKGTTL